MSCCQRKWRISQLNNIIDVTIIDMLYDILVQLIKQLSRSTLLHAYLGFTTPELQQPSTNSILKALQFLNYNHQDPFDVTYVYLIQNAANK
jgi:hypothetical protein